MQVKFPWEDEKKILYHYSSTETLINIVKGQKLWLSCISCQNDKKELTYALDMAVPAVESELVGSRHKDVMNALANRLKDLKTTPIKST